MGPDTALFNNVRCLHSQRPQHNGPRRCHSLLHRHLPHWHLRNMEVEDMEDKEDGRRDVGETGHRYFRRCLHNDRFVTLTHTAKVTYHSASSDKLSSLWKFDQTILLIYST